jgi:beta-lactamase class A
MAKNYNTNEPVYQKRIPILSALVLAGIMVLTVSSGEYVFLKNRKNEQLKAVASNVVNDCPPPSVTRFRMQDYKFAKPLLLGERNEEAKELIPLKSEIALLIDKKKQSGELNSASVYVRDLNNSKFISVNEGEEFGPGSLIKVPILMTYMREDEKHPGLLDKKIFYNGPRKDVPSQTYNYKVIEPGRYYTIRELLYQMIVYSDNNATYILNSNVNIPTFKELFISLGLGEPDVHNLNFEITASEFSRFMRVLYNATYISNEDADNALAMMTESSFKDGMIKFLPPQIKVARKIGEMGGYVAGAPKQLHESGIIFMNNNPVLVTIMTKGNDVHLLPGVISEITKLVYDKMNVIKTKG